MKKNRLNLLAGLLSIALFTMSCQHTKPTPPNYPPNTFNEADFNKDELDLSGLNKEQKEFVLHLLNHNDCTCSCSKGSWANCIKNDSHCPFSRPMGASVVKMVKEGKNKDFISGVFAGWKEASDIRRNPPKPKDPNKIYPVTTMNAPVKGPENAPVTIIEYTDYMCPFCKRAQETINALFEEYQGKIRLAVLNNPLAFHKNALSLALASRAAARQGKFWQMRAMIFENPSSLQEADLVKLAQKLGLNIEQFNKDRNDAQLKAEILAEQKQALENGANGTPAFFINGKLLSGALPLGVFKEKIESALAEQDLSTNSW